MTPTRADLLRDVACAIVSSGYAVMPLPKRLHIRRGEQIAELARDRLLDYPTHSREHSLLIANVMHRYSASRWTAREMVRQARKMREENSSHVD